MKSKLQIKRELAGLTVESLAEKAAIGIMSGCVGHMKMTIQFIETGKVPCPKPRKTYEYAALANALKCKVNEIVD